MSKKSRYEPVWADLEKSLKTVFICNMTNLVLILIVCISSYFYPFPEWARISLGAVIGIASMVSFASNVFVELGIRMNKYSLKEDALIGYCVFRNQLFFYYKEKIRQAIVPYEKINTIFIVDFYANVMVGAAYGTQYYKPNRIKGKSGEYLYDVLLFKGHYDEFDNNAQKLKDKFSYSYLYDFTYDKESVLKLLAKTSAELIVCGDFYRKHIEGDPEYSEYLDRITKFEEREDSTQKKRKNKKSLKKAPKKSKDLTEREKAVRYAKLVFANILIEIIILSVLFIVASYDYYLVFFPCAMFVATIIMFELFKILLVIWDLKMTPKKPKKNATTQIE